MVDVHIAWLKLIVCAGVIFFAGSRIARYADVIAEKTGLSRLWIGVILVAFATSLPELFTGVGSVVFVDEPNLTIGNLFGANSYNLLNIAVLDLLHRGGPLLSVLSSGQLLTVGFSLVPVALAAIAIALSGKGFSLWSVGGVGIFSIAILISYIIAARVIYKFEKKRTKSEKEDRRYEAISLKKAYLGYALAAVVILASGIWLAYIGKELAVVMGLSKSFVGSLFLGLITTLPEITVSVAALFIGAKEIAVANMFGSNLFNMTIIFVDDILYRKAPILKEASQNNLWQAGVVIAMSLVIIAAMLTKSKKRVFNISWYVPVLFLIFVLGAYISFLKG